MDPAVEARFQRIDSALAIVAVCTASVAMSQAAAEKRMDRLERIMGAMVRSGRRWRTEAKARMAQHEARMERVEANLAEISDKLNRLIGAGPQ
jgi:hypothetical protein